jgi:glycosyltransferase involved in cell wall biosynthesis
MKIAWLSPLSTKSAIGRYSQLVVDELARFHEVEAFTFDRGPLLELRVPVRTFDTHVSALPLLDKYDAVVYQIGNHWAFHGEILQSALRHPGIVVLHDHTIQHLMAAYCFEHLRNPDAYVSAMREAHGRAAEREALAAFQGKRRPVWESDDATEYPLTAAVTRNAIGVVAHSNYAREGARTACTAPMIVLPLPYSAANAAGFIGSRSDLDLTSTDLLVVTTGHANPNKRITSIVKAIGALPPALREKVVYAVLGPIEPWYAEQVWTEAAASGSSARIRLEGYVDESRLRCFLRHADLCINMRYPNFEGASASLIEQLLTANAVVVSNTGSFAELPNDVVHRTSEDDLPAAIERLLSDVAYRSALAMRAREYAVRTFRADTYADALADFADMVLRNWPLRLVADSLGTRIRELGLDPTHPWVRSVEARIRMLFVPLHPDHLEDRSRSSSI